MLNAAYYKAGHTEKLENPISDKIPVLQCKKDVFKALEAELEKKDVFICFDKVISQYPQQLSQ